MLLERFAEIVMVCLLLQAQECLMEFLNPGSTCNEALSLALDNNLSRCLIATDCLEVIRNLEEKSLCPYSAILNEIQLRKNIVGEVHFKHESRKCNGEAHS